jgi:hypothetical protein
MLLWFYVNNIDILIYNLILKFRFNNLVYNFLIVLKFKKKKKNKRFSDINLSMVNTTNNFFIFVFMALLLCLTTYCTINCYFLLFIFSSSILYNPHSKLNLSQIFLTLITIKLLHSIRNLLRMFIQQIIFSIIW